MSNLDLWYCAGIVILGASFSYIVLSAAQFMGKKEQKSAATASESNAPSTTFLRNALMAFVGIMIGSQLLQYHQDQQELFKKDITKDMAMARAMSSKSAPAARVDGKAPAHGGMGSRPTTRPPRGFFSVEEAEKAGALAKNAAVARAAEPVAPAVVSTPSLTPQSAATKVSSAPTPALK